MSFNKGDKVRVVGGPSLDKRWNGIEGVITEVIPGAPWPLRISGFVSDPDIPDHIGEVFLNPMEVELIVEEPTTDEAVTAQPEATVKPEPEAKTHKEALVDFVKNADGGGKVINDYIADLIQVYGLMEAMNRSTGAEYPANIYKAVIAEIAALQAMVKDYIKKHD